MTFMPNYITKIKPTCFEEKENNMVINILLTSSMFHTFQMMAVQSLDDDAKYSPLFENCTNQTSFLWSYSVCKRL